MGKVEENLYFDFVQKGFLCLDDSSWFLNFPRVVYECDHCCLYRSKTFFPGKKK